MQTLKKCKHDYKATIQLSNHSIEKSKDIIIIGKGSLLIHNCQKCGYSREEWIAGGMLYNEGFFEIGEGDK
jgi:hypothetical protein